MEINGMVVSQKRFYPSMKTNNTNGGVE